MLNNKFLSKMINIYYKQFIVIFIICLLITIYYTYTTLFPAAYIKFRTLFQRKTWPGEELNKTVANKVFKCSNKYCDVIYKVSADGESIHGTVHFKDVSKVGDIHIHGRMWGHETYISDLGPVIGWLGTTRRWQHGTHQLYPGMNTPCCIKGKGLGCNYVAPPGTPDLTNLSYTSRDFVVKKNFCSDECPWIYNGTFIVVHGLHEQQIFDGCLTPGKAWADPLTETRFHAYHMLSSDRFEEVKQ